MGELKAFQDTLTRLGVDYEVRSNNPKPDEVTLSDGSRVKLVDKVLVKYLPKKGKVIQYSICSSRRVK